MIYLLDTNACIAHLRTKGTSPVSDRLARATPGTVVRCSVVRAELLYGAMSSQQAVKNLGEVMAFVSGFASLPFDDPAADTCARVRQQLAARGTPIGPNDLLIASIALHHRLTLVTHNTTEFGRVPSLQLVDWQSSP